MPVGPGSTRAVSVGAAQLTSSLQRTGLSMLGIRQALQGDVISQPTDRAVIAKIVSAFATLPPNTQYEVYDFPGEYAQRFDGVAPGGKPSIPSQPGLATRKP
jgi:hypothetical protein